MKLLSIDLRMLHASGIGTYLQNLVPRLITDLSDTRFELLGNSAAIGQYDWAEKKGVTIVDCHSPIYSMGEQLELVRKISKNTDLFWSPHYNFPLSYRGKLLVTVHDVFHLAMSQYVAGLHRKLYAKFMFYALTKKADAILCDSHFTAQELTRLAGTVRKDINVIHLGVDESWYHVKKQQNPQNNPYLLFVGNVKPHKNLSALIQAFESVMHTIPHDLIIVGKKDSFITADNDVVHKAARLGNRVQFTGHVEDALLRQYFVHADALVFPSLYEGFGLPPLEAMACGCPVIVSTAASLPEVCGEAALYCDPYSPGDIAGKIQMLTSDNTLRETLRQKGQKHAMQFTWENCARETCEVVESIFRSN
jgi:glycosyltransferase involved in cell wall biosynthesis